MFKPVIKRFILIRAIWKKTGEILLCFESTSNRLNYFFNFLKFFLQFLVGLYKFIKFLDQS